MTEVKIDADELCNIQAACRKLFHTEQQPSDESRAHQGALNDLEVATATIENLEGQLAIESALLSDTRECFRLCQLRAARLEEENEKLREKAKWLRESNSALEAENDELRKKSVIHAGDVVYIKDPVLRDKLADRTAELAQYKEALRLLSERHDDLLKYHRRIRQSAFLCCSYDMSAKEILQHKDLPHA